MPELAPQTIVDGRYRVLDRLGSGGMADVFCAQDEQLGRRVALKLLHRRFAADEAFVERFRREAQAAAGLQHPNVVGVYDRGRWDGTWYIAMEYVDGSTLKDLVRRQGPLPPHQALDITAQILKAARFAHKRGIVHRDLKPHNVIIDAEGRAKVTDFGIARAGASDMTETGSILGTAQYLSPEQAQGHAVSAQSDLYAIGVILYELLTGRVPFDGDSAVSIALKQVTEAPVPPSQVNPAVPADLDALTLWALEKDPARRPTDADHFLAALEEVRARLADGAVPHTTSWAAPVDPLAAAAERERRSWWWLAAVLLVLLLAGGAYAAYKLTRPEQVVLRSVVGQKVTVAQTLLENDGFTVNVVRRTDRRPTDQVIAQNPLAGDKEDKGSTVTLTVSDGPGQNVIPDVTGRTQAAATKALRRAGFAVAVRQERSSDVTKGSVVRTSPDAGSQLERGSTVTLVVSSGPPLVSVPGVIGDDRGGARATLQNAGLNVAERQLESTKDPGTVLAQTPAAGTAVARGTTVTITVAKEALVSVPSVAGLDQDAAVNRLSAAGFTPRIVREDVPRPEQDGKVRRQSPASGTRLQRGARVTIVVGRFNPDLNPGDGGTPTTTTPTTTTPTTPTTPGTGGTG